MLNAYALMVDIDVDHWRNLQTLLLETASGRPWNVLIHENGELLKFIHSERADIVKGVERIDDPLKVAEKVYNDNPDKADFVVVFECRAVDRYFARVQDTWKAGEYMDEYMHRIYAILDEYPEGIVTYPVPASTMLGLQWRVAPVTKT